MPKHSKKKTITISVHVDGNGAFSVVHEKAGVNSQYSIVPTSVIDGLEDPEAIIRAVEVFEKESARKIGSDWFSLIAVTDRYMDHYVRESHCSAPSRTRLVLSWSDALDKIENGEYENIVHDNTGINGFFYDAKFKPVPRGIWIDSTELTGRFLYHNPKRMSMKQIIDRLKRHPKTEVSMVDRSSWETDTRIPGKIAKFRYDPTPREFANMIKRAKEIGGEFWSCHMRDVVFERLKFLDEWSGDDEVEMCEEQNR